ncbi:phage tail tape measure protein [Alistipes sp.]|uniref:phage tail tape measure protein n=1 Tax=Alistipes sp. TaxID=1872444 RepID=UPI0035273279
MAKTLKEEDLRLNIIINGDPARKEILQLTRNSRDLRAENEKLRAEQKRLNSAGGENKARINEITAAIKQNTETIKANEARVKQLQSQMKLTSMTTAELSQRHAELRLAMRNAVPGTPQWQKFRVELQAVSARLGQLRAETISTEGAMCRMASNVNKYIGTVMAGFAGLGLYFSGLQKAIQTYSSLDEAMSNARKTTGMTRQEVEELNTCIRNIDTRTAQEELLSLARVGGKLGIAKQDIEGFTRAADVIKISLGKDLGDDVETTIGQIGKLVNVFQVNKEFGIEQGMMKTAAAVNELGKSSTANEANIVEFMRRVGGVGYSAKMSLANIAGLGATLDDLGQTMEVAGTSMSQVITGMFKRTDAFAAAAKMSVSDFKKLMAEDMNEAIIRFAEGLGGDKAAMGNIVAALDSLKLNGTRATGVLTALAQNTDKLRSQQEIANKAFDEGTSCLKEFNIMNSSTEATTEKLRKRIAEEAADLGKSLVPAYHSGLSVKVSFIKATRILVEWLIKNRGAILGLLATYAAYKTVIVGVNYAKKAYATTVATLRGIKLAYVLAVRATTTATVAETGVTKAATIATRLFGIALKATPLGWAAVAIGAVVGAFTYFATRANEASSAQRTFNEVTKAAAEIEDEHGVNLVGKAEKMSRLMRVVEDEATSEERRVDAIRELQELMPDGIDLINEETIANGNAAKSVKAYTEQLILQATLKAALQKKEDLINKAGQDKLTGKDKEVSLFKRALFSYAASNTFGLLNYDKMVANQEERNKQKYQKNLDEQLADLDEIIEDAQNKLNAKSLVVPNPTTENNGNNNNDDNDWGLDDANQKWRLENDAAFLAKKSKLRQKYAAGEIATEQAYNDQLLALEISSLQNRLAANKESGEDRSKLEIQLADKLIEQKKREQQQTEAAENLRIQNITDATERENAEYEQKKKQYAGNAAALEQLALAHNRKLTKINLQRATAALKQEESSYKQSRQLMQDRHKIELQTANLTKTERARLKRQQTNELKALDEEYLRSALAQLQTLSTEGKMSFRDLKGVLQSIELDTTLLSEEEKNELIRRIKEVSGAIDSAADKIDELGYSFTQNQGGNLFGFSQDDWELFFENLSNGKFGAEELTMALLAALEAANMALELYSSYDKMITAKENAELKRYKKNQDTKKKQLQSRLDAGLITEEQHTQAVEQMEAEYERKQEELQLKQAKRQKQQSIIQTTINTAAGIVKTLAQWGVPWGLIPAGIMAAMGAAQIAMISATPITGAEEGGFPVERAQDGKRFNAHFDPNARGYVNRPTVLVGENGMEYVIPNEAMQNPTAAPIINTIEAVRRQGRLRDFDFTQAFSPAMRTPGYATGGAIGVMPEMDANIISTTSDNKELIQVINRLSAILAAPIRADVSLMGRNGFLEKYAEYERMKNRGQIG